jgi:hypothetical protein
MLVEFPASRTAGASRHPRPPILLYIDPDQQHFTMCTAASATGNRKPYIHAVIHSKLYTTLSSAAHVDRESGHAGV